MAEEQEFLKLLRASFPVLPLPQSFFWARNERTRRGDTPDELARRLAQRPWTDVTIRDWAMVGAPPCVIRSYLKPSTFLYYLPSLLLGTLQEAEYIDFAIDGMIPYNKHHRPRGEWWSEFEGAVSRNQRVALLAFLTNIEPTLSAEDSAMREHVAIARSIWSLDPAGQ